jgi:uncharacterized protein YdeI (YjbR/CyaY-like superfamily)
MLIFGTKKAIMRTTKTNVADLIAEMKPWEEELLLLREIILSTGLKEEIKWGAPTYTLDGKNVLAIGGFKNFATIWFHQGVFLSDPQKVLVNASEGKTRGLRQWRFTSKDEIKPALVKKYVLEALKNAKEGKEIKPEKKASMPIPTELAAAFKKDKVSQSCFDKLTPGKQREYIEYIADAKQEATRLRRVQKSMPMILAGIGLNDKYK